MNAILLGIFTGKHAGAEALFEAGEYTIGSAQECDVALTDSTLAPRHCSFLLAADGAVRLSPLEGAVTLDGKNVSAPLDWSSCAPVLAGMVCLAWTRPGQGWADMKLPSLLAAQANFTETPGTERQNGGLAKLPDGQQPTYTMTPPSSGARRPGRLKWLAASAVVILCLAGLTIDFSSSRGKSAHWMATLEQSLAEAGFQDLLVSEYAGRRMISGLVPTEVDANKVHDIAAGQSYPLQVTVRTQDEFSSAILTALSGRGFFPQVRMENKEAVLLGYALDRLTENAALSWARNAAPRVAPIRSALLTRSAVEETLAAQLDKAGLRGKITVDWRPGIIALIGEVTDKNALHGVMEAVRGALHSPIAFQLGGGAQERIYVGAAGGLAGQGGVPGHAQEQAGQAGQGSPFGERLSLRSVSPVPQGNAGLPFITTSDGAVYFLGGALPSGYTLTGIYTDRLEFSRNGTNMAYKLQGR